MEFDDVPHGRLALLLLDNAAETMLMRRAKESLDWADWYGGLLKQLEQLDANNDEVKLLREEIEAKTVSDRTRQRLEQNFDDLARFVFSLDDCHLDPEFVACLKALYTATATMPITATSFAKMFCVQRTTSTSTCAATFSKTRSSPWGQSRKLPP